MPSKNQPKSSSAKHKPWIVNNVKSPRSYNKKLGQRDLDLLKKYWLAGYDGEAISHKLKIGIKLITSNLKKMNLMPETKITSLTPLTASEVVAFEEKENLVKFLKEKYVSGVGNRNTQLNSLLSSETELLKYYDISNYEYFKTKYSTGLGSNIEFVQKAMAEKMNQKRMVFSKILPVLFFVLFILGLFLFTYLSDDMPLIIFGLGIKPNIMTFFSGIIFCFGLAGLSELILDIIDHRGRREIMRKTFSEERKFQQEKWSLMKVNRLKLLADQGLELSLIASEIQNISSPASHALYLSKQNSVLIDNVIDKHWYNEASIRAKLVSLGIYTDYQEKNWQYQNNQHKILSRKLQKEFGAALPLKTTSRIKDPKYIASLISNHENKTTEFKQTFFINTFTKTKDVDIIHSALKTICGFLNTTGGILLIGVRDNQTISGIFDDNFTNQDKYKLDIQNLIKSGLGIRSIENIAIEITKMPGSEEVCVIHCEKGSEPSWLSYKGYNKQKKYPESHEEFFVRGPSATNTYPPSQQSEYINKHWD